MSYGIRWVSNRRWCDSRERRYQRAMSILLAFALVSAAALPLPVHVGGRTVAESGGVRRFGWPAVYFESRFRGTAVRVRFEAKEDFLRLLVDGREIRLFSRPGPVDFAVTGLAKGMHTVRLEKLTESQDGASRFSGFYAMRGSVAVPAPRRLRQIEFIGDSYTAGYGNMSDTRTCSKAEVHDRTNTQAAFGPIVAKHYGADYRVNAYSGIGIVRNYDGSAPGVTMPRLYWHALPQLDAPVDRPAGDWRPQLIVVKLGANDFSTPLHPGERWPDQPALEKDFAATFVDFMTRVHARQPQTAILLMSADTIYPKITLVAATLRQAGIKRVTTLEFSGLDLGGCDYHPSLRDHQKLAVLVEQAVDRANLLGR